MKLIIVKSMVVSGTIFLLIMTSIPLTISSDVTIDKNLTSNPTNRSRASWYVADGKSYSERTTEKIKNIDLPLDIDDEFNMIADGPMDSPWPMLSHDFHHTGLSTYSTEDNPGFEKWRFRSIWDGPVESTTAVIDNLGFIYFGSVSSDGRIYSLNPNGTLKWWYPTGQIWSTPSLDDTGVLYVGNYIIPPSYLYAIFINNGTLKWKYPIGGTLCSPVVAEDGTIIFGDDNYNIIALYPNGTLKWTYSTGDFVASSPAIDDNGIIYIGSSDGYLYSLYPNGTLNWRYGTGGWIKGHPTIADDGIIYVPSFDGYLYALYPNGSLKWRTDYGEILASAGAVIGPDGIIYIGTNALRSFYPENGTLKWNCDVGGYMYGTVPAISADGTIFVSADCDGSGGDLVAVNPDGTIKWNYHIADVDAKSSPCIGEDGTIYVGSTWLNPENNFNFGYLHAFNSLDPNASSAPSIDGPVDGKAGVEYEYFFTSVSPLDNDVFYYVDWGDGYWTDWFGPYVSGGTASAFHTWKKDGNYTIRVRAKDVDNLWGPWGDFEFEVLNSRPDKPIIDGPTSGKVGVSYDFTFKAVDPDENNLYYLIDWDDGSDTYWFGPFASGEEVTRSHKWNWKGIYSIKIKAMDICDAESDWATLDVTMPRNKIIANSLFLRVLEHFPILKNLLFAIAKNF